MGVSGTSERWRTPAWTELGQLLAPLPRWWVAGGWAIDRFVGWKTREHRDVDVAVLREDIAALARALSTWDVHIAHKGTLTPWDRREGSLDGRHQLWARPGPTDPWALEVLLEHHDRDRWLYRRNRDVTLPLAKLGRAATVPFIAPEVALLYKAGASISPGHAGSGCELDDRNERDFAVALKHLDGDARAWLGTALDIAHPGHAWRARLITS